MPNRADELVGLLVEEISKLNEHPIDSYSGDTLSRVCVRLASYKAGLGTYVSSARGDTWRAEKALAEAKANGYQMLRDEGRSQGDADSLKATKCQDEYDNWIRAKELEDRLVGMSLNIHDLIDAIKSRLIYMQMELKESQAF